MTKNLIQLSSHLLAKFGGIDGSPGLRKLSSPVDLDAERRVLSAVQKIDYWTSPSGVRIFEFIYNDCLHVAVTFSISTDRTVDLMKATTQTITVTDVVGSVFLYLAFWLDLKATRASPENIEEYIVGPSQTSEGVDLKTVREYLEEITIFRVDEDSAFSGDVSRKYRGYYLCTFDPRYDRSNCLTTSSVEIIRQMFYAQKEELIVANLFQAMTTPVPRHAFLEIYRLLEFIFVLPRAKALLDELGKTGKLDVKILEFARKCYRQLGWKRVERDSLARLFQEYGVFSLDAFKGLCVGCGPFSSLLKRFKLHEDQSRTDFIDKVSETYYRLRNQVAHQLWPEDEIACSDEDWKALAEFTLGCISYLYAEHLSVAV